MKLDERKNYNLQYHDKYKIFPLNVEQTIKLVFGYFHLNKLNSCITPKEVIDICLNYYYESTPITTNEGIEMALQIKAKQYKEVSAFTQFGLRNLFDTAIRESLVFSQWSNTKKKKKNCILM